MIRQALGLLLLALVLVSSCLPSPKQDTDGTGSSCTLQTTSLYDDITATDANQAKAALEIAQNDTVFTPRDEAVVVVFWGFMGLLSRDGVLDDAFFDLDMAGELSRIASRYPSVFVPCHTATVSQAIAVGCVFEETKGCIKDALLAYLGEKLPDWNEIQTAGIALIKLATTLNDLKEAKQLTVENLAKALTGEDMGAIVKTMVGGIGVAGGLASLLCATNPFCAGLATAATIVGVASVIWECGSAAKAVVIDKKCGCFFTICNDGVCECDEPLHCPQDCGEQEEPGVPICMQAPAHPVTCCTCGGPMYVEGGPDMWEVVRQKLCLTMPLMCDPEATPEMVTREVAIQDCWTLASTTLDAEDCCAKYGGYSDKGGKENCGVLP